MYGAVEFGAVRAAGNAQFARRKPDKEFRRRRDDGALTLGAFAYRARFAHGARADDIAVADLRHFFARISPDDRNKYEYRKMRSEPKYRCVTQ